MVGDDSEADDAEADDFASTDDAEADDFASTDDAGAEDFASAVGLKFRISRPDVVTGNSEKILPFASIRSPSPRSQQPWLSNPQQTVSSSHHPEPTSWKIKTSTSPRSTSYEN